MIRTEPWPAHFQSFHKAFYTVKDPVFIVRGLNYTILTNIAAEELFPNFHAVNANLELLDEVYPQLYIILKETISNVLKYGDAKELKINNSEIFHRNIIFKLCRIDGLSDNEECAVLIRCEAYSSNHGDDKRVSSEQNLSNIKEGEQQLFSEKFNESIIKASPNLIYIYDLITDQNFFASPQIIEILGFTPEEVKAMGNKFLSSRFHPEDLITVDKHIHALLSDINGGVFEVEYRMLKKNGEWVWLNDRSRVFERDSSGKPIKTLGIATDITERKKTLLQLERSERKLRKVIE